jgi:hypothetical protein
MAEKRAHTGSPAPEAFYLKCEANLKQYIRDYVHRLPSVGKTIN